LTKTNKLGFGHYDLNDKKIIESFDRKIQRFNEYLDSDLNILFIYINEDFIYNEEYRHNNDYDYLIELNDYISNFNPKLKFNILNITFDETKKNHKNIINLRYNNDSYISKNDWIDDVMIRSVYENKFRNNVSLIIKNFLKNKSTCDNVNYISLGLNCLPRTHYTTAKIMNSKKDGYKSCPFDLMISSYEGICRLIENDFKDFYHLELINNPVNCSYPKNKLFHSNSFGNNYDDGMIVNKKYNLCFNHESPGNIFLQKTEKWTSHIMFVKNTCEIFKERYTNRINNFNEYIQNAITNQSTIIFLLNTFNTPIKLKYILIKKYPSLKFKIITNLMDEHNKKFFMDFQNFINNNKNDLDFEETFDIDYKDEHIIMNGFEKIKDINILKI
jgi:hypothetical protein